MYRERKVAQIMANEEALLFSAAVRACDRPGSQWRTGLNDRWLSDASRPVAAIPKSRECRVNENEPKVDSSHSLESIGRFVAREISSQTWPFEKEKISHRIEQQQKFREGLLRQPDWNHPIEPVRVAALGGISHLKITTTVSRLFCCRHLAAAVGQAAACHTWSTCYWPKINGVATLSVNGYLNWGGERARERGRERVYWSIKQTRGANLFGFVTEFQWQMQIRRTIHHRKARHTHTRPYLGSIRAVRKTGKSQKIRRCCRALPIYLFWIWK